MPKHPRTGLGPDMTQDELRAIGQAELDRLTKPVAPEPADDDATPTDEGEAQ